LVYQTDGTAGFYYNAGTAASPEWVLLIGGPISGSDIAAGVQTTTNTTLALGNSDDAARELRLLEPSGSGSNFSAFKAQAQAGNVTYTLPSAGPSADGQVLSSTTGGLMSWTTPSGGGGTVSRNNTLTGDGSAGSPLGLNLGNSNTWTANQTFASSFLITSNANIAMTNSTNASSELRIQEPSGTGTQYIGIRCPSVNRNGRYTFPAVVGTVGQVLKIASVVELSGQDEAQLVWGDAGSGGGGASARVRAYRSSAQTGVTYTSTPGPLTWTTILFNDENYDTGSEFNTVNGQFTAAAAGQYLISATHSSTAAIGGKMIRITVNGSSAAHGASNAGNGGITVSSHISTVLQLAAGDVVEIQAAGYNGSGGTFSLNGSSDETFVQITKLQ
jgi:hypothetical protein